MSNFKHYADFIKGKAIVTLPTGLEPAEPSEMLFPFQRDIVKWALRRGRAAIFADCGMGKTPMQLSWAAQVPGKVLILAPLAVAAQTVREGKKFGIKVVYSRKPVDEQITITNYEMLEHFDPSEYTGIVLDESSILKAYDGKFRNQIIESFAGTPFKLACTATPAPNDHMELGNHAEFLGVLTRTEMLSTFFVHDGGDTSKWRLKGHAERDFWRWICSWAVMIRKPSDLGYEDGEFILPALNMHPRIVEAEHTPDGALFALEASTLQERQEARRLTTEERARAVAEIVATRPDEPWLIWCNLNTESQTATKMIPGAVELTGSDTAEEKEAKMLGFSTGEVQILVTKPSIAGFGMNWQHCRNVIFLGLSDSYEQFYQAVRRCWRFGQARPVDCWIVTSDLEGAVVQNIQRKETDAARMAEEMVANMHDLNEHAIRGTVRTADEYQTDKAEGEAWTAHLGDCVDVVGSLPSDSIGYSIFSPPFASLYTYSASDRDMGNCKDADAFYHHFRFLVDELFRVIQPGRLVSFHCMNLPTSKERDGEIGIRDFRGELIRMFQDSGFVFHSEVCIWKDPVTAMQRTKALGLLWKTIKKDSAMSRQGIPDYLVTMRKPGVNPVPIAHTAEEFPVALWQRYASPVWMDINPSDTLQKESAREDKDERHICPLQLQVIQRGLELWSAPGDLVLSPFMGIGSEGYMAVKLGRRFVGAELKRSYWKQAVANLRAAEQSGMGSLFKCGEVA
jgi:DNA modification methylase/superfamily II DNA or RNA helicase